MTKQKLKDVNTNEQSQRFEEAVQKLVDAGELDRIEAEKSLDGLTKRAAVSSKSTDPKFRP